MDMEKALEGLQWLTLKAWQNSEDKGWHREQKEEVSTLDWMKAAWQTLQHLPDTDPVALAAKTDLSNLINKLQDRVLRTGGVQVMSKLMLIVTEVAEAAEVYRAGKYFPSLSDCYMLNSEGEYVLYDDSIEPPAKPEGAGSELADVIIRMLDLAKTLNIDLGVEIARKMRYNAIRPERHGGKIV